MIDTHCHLTDPRLEEQLDGVLSRAASAGVRGMVTISTGIEDAQRCIAVARGRDAVRCTVGVHPNYVADTDLAQLPLLRGLQAAAEVVAIGEIGLDYHYGIEHRDKQIEAFKTQLQIAVDCAKPVVIHCREAIDDTLAIMGNFPVVRAVFHCFTGSVDEARKVLAAGHWLGFTGPITFKKNDALREVVSLTPLDRLLVETDAPYLSPEPIRKQKVNEPSLVMHVAATAAQVKGVSLEELDRVTTQNASRFFGWTMGGG
jgi:TatD DNase family protein